ncbi:MAG: DUF998 domain-containing protein [Candidatus Thorarchaeota archaeon]|nr:DUF998 domain-containing protein [Candidatus Thorarchaeota archaeon]
MERTTKVGFFAPFIALFCIALAILLSPGFDWFVNALSDLGHYTRTDLGPYKLIGAIIFNGGLITTGLLMLYYTIWFFRETKDAPTRIGVLPLLVSLMFLIAIGIFSENFGELHYWVSVGFFLTFPFSMWIVGIVWLRFKHLRWFSIISILLPFLSVVMWADYLNGTSIWQQAIPEIITAFSAIVWLWVINLLHYQGKLGQIIHEDEP